MPLLLFVLLVVLVATLGFWDALAAILGAAVLAVLVVLLGVALLAVGVMVFLKRKTA